MEIKKKLTVTREEGVGHNGGKKGKGRQGMCIKDPWTEPTGEGRMGKAGETNGEMGQV